MERLEHARIGNTVDSLLLDTLSSADLSTHVAASAAAPTAILSNLVTPFLARQLERPNGRLQAVGL